MFFRWQRDGWQVLPLILLLMLLQVFFLLALLHFIVQDEYDVWLTFMIYDYDYFKNYYFKSSIHSTFIYYHRST